MEANLANARFDYANLSGANLTAVQVRGSDFRFSDDPEYGAGSGLSLAQLYSTASYLAHDLPGINLGGNNLSGVNLAGQDLTSATFNGATLTSANFSQANLAYARFLTANLAGADLSGADLHHADFTTPYFPIPSSNLTGANLSHSNLVHANFAGSLACDEYGVFCDIVPGANLSGANLSGADARGASFQYATLTGANTSNLIQTDGHITGLDLSAGATLVVRDYDGNPDTFPAVGPIPITVDEHFTMDASGTLRLEFDGDAWDSLISFAPGIPVRLGGTLELAFAADVDVATQGGRTLDLFDWTGVSPTGQFQVASPFTWDLTQLYNTGQVTFLGGTVLPDYNGNGLVEQGDLDLVLLNWGQQLSDPAAVGWLQAVPVGVVDQAELDGVLLQWGHRIAGVGAMAIPEPSAWLIMVSSLAAAIIFLNGRGHLPSVRV